MSTLSSLSHEQLEQIINLSSSDEEIDGISIKQLINGQILPAHIMAYIKKKNRLRPIQNTIEVVGGLIETWWAIVSIVSLTLFFTMGAAIVIGLAGIAYSGYAYQEQKKEEQRFIESYQLSLLKLQAAELLYEKTTRAQLKNLPPYIAPKTKIIGIGLLMSVTVFFSYFYGVSSIIQSLGYLSAASAMTGPIGLAVAAVVAIGLGLYFGFKYYEDKKYKHLIKSEQKIVESQVKAITYKNGLNGSSKIIADGLGVKTVAAAPSVHVVDSNCFFYDNIFSIESDAVDDIEHGNNVDEFC